MSVDESGKRGHWPSLVAGFLYFALSLMLWVLLGVNASAVSDALALTPGQKAMMVALPIMIGVGLRPLAGLLADRVGARRVALAGLGLTALPLFLGWLWASSFAQILVVGALLGVAGASFSVALAAGGALVSGGTPGIGPGPGGGGELRGAVAALLAPRLLPLVGWHGVFGLGLIPLALAFVAVAALAQGVPRARSPPKPLGETWKTLGRRDTYWYCGFYALTFGGLVGTMSFLSMFFHDQYEVDPDQAVTIAALFALAGSLARPIGGFLADRYGGTSVLFLAYLAMGLLGLRMSYIPHLEMALGSLMLLFVVMGMGNGAIFQMIPQRFPDEMGAVTGMVGAAGRSWRLPAPARSWATRANGWAGSAPGSSRSACADSSRRASWSRPAGNGTRPPTGLPAPGDPGARSRWSLRRDPRRVFFIRQFLGSGCVAGSGRLALRERIRTFIPSDWLSATISPKMSP